MKKYEIGEKEYVVNIPTKRNIEQLIPTILQLYTDMCEYHDKEVVNEQHIKNYIRTRLGISISTADMIYVLEKISDYRNKKAKETLKRLRTNNIKGDIYV